jgi:hypothetical protein
VPPVLEFDSIILSAGQKVALLGFRKTKKTLVRPSDAVDGS